MTGEHACQGEYRFRCAALKLELDLADRKLAAVMFDFAAIESDFDQRAIIFGFERGTIDHRRKERTEIGPRSLPL